MSKMHWIKKHRFTVLTILAWVLVIVVLALGAKWAFANTGCGHGSGSGSGSVGATGGGQSGSSGASAGTGAATGSGVAAGGSGDRHVPSAGVRDSYGRAVIMASAAPALKVATPATSKRSVLVAGGEGPGNKKNEPKKRSKEQSSTKRTTSTVTYACRCSLPVREN